jgi:hypothetical protein
MNQASSENNSGEDEANNKNGQCPDVIGDWVVKVCLLKKI